MDRIKTSWGRAVPTSGLLKLVSYSILTPAVATYYIQMKIELFFVDGGLIT